MPFGFGANPGLDRGHTGQVADSDGRDERRSDRARQPGVLDAGDHLPGDIGQDLQPEIAQGPAPDGSEADVAYACLVDRLEDPAQVQRHAFQNGPGEMGAGVFHRQAHPTAS